MPMSESERVIRTLYEITTEYEKGFRYQVHRLLNLGCERFNLNIGILSRVVRKRYEVIHHICPSYIALKDGDIFDLSHTYCSITLEAKGPVGFEHIKESEIRTHPAYKKFPLESYIGTPVHVDGKIYGTFNFSSPRPASRAFKNIDLDALQLMASWLGTELSRLKSEAKLKEANSKLHKLANTDSLTNLKNRRAFQEELNRFIHAAKRTNKPLSLMIIDVDKFKQYNDSYGHLNGDEILRTIANLLVNNSRGSDLVARFGGEEFAIILPETNCEGAIKFGKEICHAIRINSWTNRKITVSGGLSTMDNKIIGDEDITPLSISIINQADKALYFSKENGRNISTHFGEIE